MLTVNGSLIPEQGLQVGPFLCEQGNPNQCYQPAAANVLNVVKTATPPPVIIPSITATPTLLNLTEGGPAQTVIISNTSSTTAIENLQATIPGTSAITIDAAQTTCTSTLAAKSSCQYSFLPGNQPETNTMISINGSNTTGAATITASVSAVVLNVLPASLSFAVGSTGSITVLNTSSSTAAMGLQVSIPATSHLTVDTVASTCTIGGTISASGSCTLVLTTAANEPIETGTVITINGSNTNISTATVSTTSAILSLTSPTTIQTLIADGTSTLSITVQNMGTATADNVQMSSAWTGVIFNPSSCGNITAGNSCTFTISSNTPNLAGQISIQGSNTNAVTNPYIAFQYQGYLVYSVSGTSPNGIAKVIYTTDNSSGIEWDSAPGCLSNNCTQTNATSLTNGAYLDSLGNSYLIIGNPPSATPPHIGLQAPLSNAAATCYNISSDNTGVSPPTTVPNGTWYLPAVCELGGNNIAAPTCPGVANIYNDLAAYGFGNFVDTYPSGWWSSTEVAANSAWYEILFPGLKGNIPPAHKALGYLRVRCVQAISY